MVKYRCWRFACSFECYSAKAFKAHEARHEQEEVEDCNLAEDGTIASRPRKKVQRSRVGEDDNDICHNHFSLSNSTLLHADERVTRRGMSRKQVSGSSDIDPEMNGMFHMPQSQSHKRDPEKENSNATQNGWAFVQNAEWPDSYLTPDKFAYESKTPGNTPDIPNQVHRVPFQLAWVVEESENSTLQLHLLQENEKLYAYASEHEIEVGIGTLRLTLEYTKARIIVDKQKLFLLGVCGAWQSVGITSAIESGMEQKSIGTILYLQLSDGGQQRFEDCSIPGTHVSKAFANAATKVERDLSDLVSHVSAQQVNSFPRTAIETSRTPLSDTAHRRNSVPSTIYTDSLKSDAKGFEGSSSSHNLATPSYSSSKRASRRGGHTPRGPGNHIFVKYPFTGSDQVTILVEDLDLCNTGRWLNDTLITFRLKYLMTEFPSEHVCTVSSYFYSQLTGKQIRGNPQLELPVQQRESDMFEVVGNWGRTTDFFGKLFVLLPINERNVHWSLAIVCNARQAMEDSENELSNAHTNESKRTKTSQKGSVPSFPPMIVHVDSYRSCHDGKAIAHSIRSFLSHEWKARNVRTPKKSRNDSNVFNLREGVNNDDDDDESIPEHNIFDRDPSPKRKKREPLRLNETDATLGECEMPLKEPEVARQDNGHDCGVYVLKFAESLLRNVNSILRESARHRDNIDAASECANVIASHMQPSRFASGTISTLRNALRENLEKVHAEFTGFYASQVDPSE